MIRIGDVTLSDVEMPDKLPILTGSLDGSAVTLSDGTRLYQPTGWTDDDLVIQTVLWERQSGQFRKPFDRVQRLHDLGRIGKYLSFYWSGNGQSGSQTVQITKLEPYLMMSGDIDVSVTLFIPSAGGLVASGSPGTQAVPARVANGLRLLRIHGRMAGPSSASAVQALSDIYDSIPSPNGAVNSVQ